MSLILASDVGGTKTILALYNFDDGRLQLVFKERYVSRAFKSFDELLKNFFLVNKIFVSNAVFGVPGPVLNNSCRTPNLPWVMDGDKLARRFHFDRVKLVNDFYAFGSGVELLPKSDFAKLNNARPIEKKGTGLGETVAVWNDGYHVYSSEGGHCDFAPRNDLEISLLKVFMAKFGHVSVERLLSGRGLSAIYRFLNGNDVVSDEDLSLKIVDDALHKRDSVAVKAVDVFVSIYGAEAGNLVLKTKAISGLYVGGGIARALLTGKYNKIFLKSFYDKGRLSYLMKKIPVLVVLNSETGVLGAANYARKFFFNDAKLPSSRPLDL